MKSRRSSLPYRSQKRFPELLSQRRIDEVDEFSSQQQVQLSFDSSVPDVGVGNVLSVCSASDRPASDSPFLFVTPVSTGNLLRRATHCEKHYY
jgi:hypothetical protein